MLGLAVSCNDVTKRYRLFENCKVDALSFKFDLCVRVVRLLLKKDCDCKINTVAEYKNINEIKLNYAENTWC